jgi:multiple sugar transport system permease protein
MTTLAIQPNRFQPGRLLAWVMLGLFVLISLIPIWVALKTALIPPAKLFAGARDLVPQDPTFANFLRVLGLSSTPPRAGQATINFALALRNSAIFTLIVVSGQLFFSAMAAYAFARLRFWGRDVLFYAFLAATMIPSIVLFIPNFVLIKDLGWLDTFQGMVAPYVLMTPFAVFFLRQFFLTTPKELEEAAKLDGASTFTIFWRIVLPVHRGAIATLAILLGINAWNEFFWPFLVGRAEDVRVMAVALGTFMSQQQSSMPDWTGLMACTILSILPMAVVLVLFGRRVVESLQFSGSK